MAFSKRAYFVKRTDGERIKDFFEMSVAPALDWAEKAAKSKGDLVVSNDRGRPLAFFGADGSMRDLGWGSGQVPPWHDDVSPRDPLDDSDEGGDR